MRSLLALLALSPALAGDGPVKVYVLAGQSNMVGIGQVTSGGTRWGAEFLDPVVSVYQGAHDPDADYDALVASWLQTAARVCLPDAKREAPSAAWGLPCVSIDVLRSSGRGSRSTPSASLRRARQRRAIQLPKCMRDEDPRADRQAEFTQIDLEMSFVDRDDVMELTSEFARAAWKEIRGIEIGDIPRITWRDAMERYGIDHNVRGLKRFKR